MARRSGDGHMTHSIRSYLEGVLAVHRSNHDGTLAKADPGDISDINGSCFAWRVMGSDRSVAPESILGP